MTRRSLLSSLAMACLAGAAAARGPEFSGYEAGECLVLPFDLLEYDFEAIDVKMDPVLGGKGRGVRMRIRSYVFEVTHKETLQVVRVRLEMDEGSTNGFRVERVDGDEKHPVVLALKEIYPPV